MLEEMQNTSNCRSQKHSMFIKSIDYQQKAEKSEKSKNLKQHSKISSTRGKLLDALIWLKVSLQNISFASIFAGNSTYLSFDKQIQLAVLLSRFVCSFLSLITELFSLITERPLNFSFNSNMDWQHSVFSKIHK
jgi:hypothetical protein